ncbi:HNH endonuclease [Staphylococcus succinus]|uniref:HNH endonuclease n=1 Tax=Staphylococcus succinus TaxID=61015 RepID=UPI00301C2277
MIRDNGLCMYCLHNGMYTQATLVDHFIPIRDSYEDRYNTNNLVSACVACNTKKAVDENRLRSKQITFNEFKTLWKYARDTDGIV